MRRGKEILEFLRSRPGGASTVEIAWGLRIRPRRAGEIIRELELVGEVFRCNEKWKNTEAALELNERAWRRLFSRKCGGGDAGGQQRRGEDRA